MSDVYKAAAALLPGNLSKPSVRALEGAGITTLQQVAEHSAAELLRLHGFGPKSVRQLTEALAELGLAFRPE